MKTEEDYMQEFRAMCNAQKPEEDNPTGESDNPALPSFSGLGLSLGALLASVLKPLPLPETPESVCREMKSSSDLEVHYYASRLEAALEAWKPFYSQDFRKETTPFLSQKPPF